MLQAHDYKCYVNFGFSARYVGRYFRINKKNIFKKMQILSNVQQDYVVLGLRIKNGRIPSNLDTHLIYMSVRPCYRP